MGQLVSPNARGRTSLLISNSRQNSGSLVRSLNHPEPIVDLWPSLRFICAETRVALGRAYWVML